MSFINSFYENVFVHVPKTAGTAMEQKPFVGGSSHDNLYQLSKKPNFKKSYLKWGFVRNPYTRLASAYFYGINNLQRDIKIIDPEKTFKSFVIHLKENLGKNPNNPDRNIIPDFVHILPQTYFLNGIEINIDFVGRYENLQRDWKHIIVKIIENSGKTDILRKPKYHMLEKANRTKWKPLDYMTIYDQETKDMVYKVYEKDFAIFKYSK